MSKTKHTLDHWLFGAQGLNDYLDKLRKNGANIHQINQLTRIVQKFSDFDILHGLSNWSLGYLHGAAGSIIAWAKETLNETNDAYIRTLLTILIGKAEMLQMMIMKVLEHREIDLETAKGSDPFPVGPGPIVAPME